jgi:hypothetical protein
MVWTTPPTFTVGQILTAALLNAISADLVDLNSRTTPTAALIATAQGNTSTTYADLAVPAGPKVTVTTGTTAIVVASANMFNNGGSTQDLWFSWDITGATTVPAADQWGCRMGNVPPAINGLRASTVWMATGLTPGINTFTMKYRSSGGLAANWNDRQIIVWPASNVT